SERMHQARPERGSNVDLLSAGRHSSTRPIHYTRPAGRSRAIPSIGRIFWPRRAGATSCSASLVKKRWAGRKSVPPRGGARHRPGVRSRRLPFDLLLWRPAAVPDPLPVADGCARMPQPDPPNVWALSDLSTPWCVHVAATLQVAEKIAAGLAGISEIAAAVG